MDHENRFMNVNVGWTGSVYMMQEYCQTQRCLIERQEHLYPTQSVQILAGVPVPVVVFNKGAGAYARVPAGGGGGWYY